MKRSLLAKLTWSAVLIGSVILSALYVPQINLNSAYFDDLDNTDVKQWLSQVPPLKIEVMAGADSRAGAYVANFLAPLNDYWSDLTVHYLDPAKHPEKVRDYGIKARGEMIVYDGDQSFVLSDLSYETLFNGLHQLLNPSQGWLVVLDGFAGQNLHADNPDGLGLWLKTIQQLNYSVSALTWQPDMALPSDVKVIMLASPGIELSEAALQWLQQQLAQGISLWWLSNPGEISQQPRLSVLFDVLPADPALPEIAPLQQYPDHAITRQFSYPTTWQGVAPFSGSGDTVLQHNGQVFATAQSVKGARMLMVGDSDFMNNSLLNSGGNQALSLRMLDWLMHHDHRINLPDLSAQQTGLFLTRHQLLLISGLLLIGMPLLAMLVALITWYQNNRQSRQEQKP